jgi:RNA polymerase sigma-70 factor (ECF subfamily)
VPAEQDRTGAESLVAAARGGDRDALAALWQTHRRWIAAVLLTYMPHDADLEDLLQEVAMRMVNRIETLRDNANVRAWLRAVAVNVARSTARSHGTRRRHEGPGMRPLEEVSGPARWSQRLDEEALAMVDRIGRLPEQYREPLVLRAVQGMNTKQIAEVLELAPATVDTRIARARRMLRETVADLDEATAVGPRASGLPQEVAS